MQNNPSGIVFSDEAIIPASVFIGLALGIAVGFLLINVSIKFPQKVTAMTRAHSSQRQAASQT